MTHAPQLPPEDDWDSYPCRVDDAPASILLNLRFESQAPADCAATLYWLQIQLREKADHGMGSAAESEILQPAEHQITARAEANGFFYVGRLRCGGRWQLLFYGSEGRLSTIQILANELESSTGRSVEPGSMLDPSWNYYLNFLLPDTERRQWMRDQRTVELLKECGDPLLSPRRVDHWLAFQTALQRDAFVCAVSPGFTIECTLDHGEGDFRFGARVHRVDYVDVESIHDVVMDLVQLAKQHGGHYDGWETSPLVST
ncbi:MAG: DUF695 domain-containing protein [Kofleriaceae bacterium]